MRVEGDGFDFSTGAAGCDRMAELMEGNHQHLSHVSRNRRERRRGKGIYFEGP
jgi:hypothetical protein